MWAHRVFNAGGDLREEIVKHRNWDINRRQVRANTVGEGAREKAVGWNI